MTETIEPAARPDAYVDDERRQLWMLAAIAVLIGGVVLWETGRLGFGELLLLTVPLLAALARWASDRFPRWLAFPAASVPAAAINLPDLATEGILFAPIAAVTYLALFEPRRWVPAVCGATAFLAPLGAVIWSGDDDWGWPFWMIGTLLGWVIGEIGHRYRQRLHELRAARQVIAEQAVLDERRRIARDVHDLVGHSLSVVMLQVNAARALVRTAPAEAEAALDDAAEAGRASMSDIRRTIGLLREGDGDGTAPAPTLDDVESLADSYRNAGLRVATSVDGDPSRLDHARSNAGYRIVQEALANAAKHGGGDTATVDVLIDAGICTLRIANPVGAPPDPSHRGLGLIGMRERAQSVGGTLTMDGDGPEWVVVAVLPGEST